jgi:hypothetical protein
VHVCALIEAKIVRLIALTRERGGRLSRHDPLISFHVLKTLNLFRREIVQVICGDDDYVFERFSGERLFGESFQPDRHDSVRVCEQWLNEWIHLAKVYREHRQPIEDLGLALPPYEMVVRANDLMLDMIRSLNFQLLKKAAYNLGFLQALPGHIEDDIDLDQDDDEGDDDEQDDDEGDEQDEGDDDEGDEDEEDDDDGEQAEENDSDYAPGDSIEPVDVTDEDTL